MYRVCTVEIYSNGGVDIVSTLKLDTRKYDDIGFTDESLDEYMNKHILRNGQFYIKSKDKIRKY